MHYISSLLNPHNGFVWRTDQNWSCYLPKTFLFSHSQPTTTHENQYQFGTIDTKPAHQKCQCHWLDERCMQYSYIKGSSIVLALFQILAEFVNCTYLVYPKWTFRTTKIRIKLFFIPIVTFSVASDIFPSNAETTVYTVHCVSVSVQSMWIWGTPLVVDCYAVVTFQHHAILHYRILALQSRVS